MAFFNDFADAVENYPKANVILTIEDVAVEMGTAGSVNVNEVWRFRVRVANNGHLDMTSVALLVGGENGVLISEAAAGPWHSFAILGPLTVDSHQVNDTAQGYFKAPNAPKPAGTTLVKAQIRSFNVNLDHILNDHSGVPAQPVGKYAAKVSP
jgi:hypothetical protein